MKGPTLRPPSRSKQADIGVRASLANNLGGPVPAEVGSLVGGAFRIHLAQTVVDIHQVCVAVRVGFINAIVYLDVIFTAEVIQSGVAWGIDINAARLSSRVPQTLGGLVSIGTVQLVAPAFNISLVNRSLGLFDMGRVGVVSGVHDDGALSGVIEGMSDRGSVGVFGFSYNEAG